MTPSPSIYEHYSPTDSDYPDGIYRVVGTSEEDVTLLRVGDAKGQRVNTGEIGTASYSDLNGFDPAENPDGNRRLADVVTSTLEMVYWSIRVFVQRLAAHPLPTIPALTLVLAGYFGEGILPLSDDVLSILIIIGSLGLAYVGSGRL